jgi:hypothetical protein
MFSLVRSISAALLCVAVLAAPRVGLGGDPGIRKLIGQRLVLFTDLAPTAEVDCLPQVFDQAFGQWCAYFQRTPESLAEWRMTGYLMKDRARFEAAGLLPENLPQFANGYSRGATLWLYDQPSDYYRRHLLLHEGTHGFINTVLTVVPPPWYQEGMAELFGTHRWHAGRLEMNYLPSSREEVPLWGRVRIVQDAVAEHRAKHLGDVLAFDGQSHGRNEPYGWCWTLATLLERDPRYHDRFRRLAAGLADPAGVFDFQRLFLPDAAELAEQWQLTVVDLDYGYDFPRASVEFAAGKPLPAEGTEVSVAAERGWQSARVEVRAGQRYRLEATGRYQVANQGKPWPCEPGGVSIRYYKGRPVGMLLAAVRPDRPRPGDPSMLLRPIVVGRGTTFIAPGDGTLYLKINDSPAELADNAGRVQVTVQPAGAG